MIWIQSISRGSFFALPDIFGSSELLIAHDDNTDGTAISVTINHHWRKFLSAIIDRYLSDNLVDFEDVDNADRDDNVGAFWNDLYG